LAVEKAPDTSDAMKRYKAGEAGFTDKHFINTNNKEKK
jgi:hypothetical protein